MTPGFKQRRISDWGREPVKLLLLRSKFVRRVMPPNMSGMVPARVLPWLRITSEVSAVRVARFGKTPVTDDTPHVGRIPYVKLTAST